MPTLQHNPTTQAPSVVMPLSVGSSNTTDDEEPKRLALPKAGSFEATFVLVGKIEPRPVPDLED